MTFFIKAVFLDFIFFLCSIQSYIREQIVQTIAVIHKRYSVDQNGKSKDTDDALFSDIARLIHTGTQHAVNSFICLHLLYQFLACRGFYF